MATEIIKQLVDDIDGGTATGTVSFSWQGQSYELDLNKKNAAAFEKAMKPYLDRARKVRGSTRGAPRSVKKANSAERLTQIRDWGRSNGFTVSDRGRVPNSLIEAFDSAH